MIISAAEAFFFFLRFLRFLLAELVLPCESCGSFWESVPNSFHKTDCTNCVQRETGSFLVVVLVVSAAAAELLEEELLAVAARTAARWCGRKDSKTAAFC